MARKSASPKRKRALQPTVSDASQQPNEEYEADVEEETRPRKRGRPRKSLDSSAQAPPKDPEPRRATRRSPRGKTNPVPAEGQAKKKRGRPSLGQKKSRDGQDQDHEEQTQSSKPGRRKKPRVSFQEEPQEEAEEQQSPGQRARGRRSLRDLPPPETNNKAAEPAAGPEKKKRGRPSGSRKSLDTREASNGQADERPGVSTRRRSSQIAQLEADAPLKSYPHVTPRVRGVKQSTIDAKWNPLSAPSIAAATEALTLAHRPIMQRLANNQQRRQHTSSALSLLHRRISRKLHRGLPFPPPGVPAAGPRRRGRRPKAGGHDAELDFESVLDGVRTLERQLDPALHSVELLHKERERMGRELERDYKTLRNLEAGARGQARQQREQLKKAHVLAPEAPENREEDAQMVFDHKGSLPPGAVFKDLEDEELKELALQLGGHMESIKNNLQQTEGLVPKMASSSAALRSVLLRHLDEEQYDRVVLG